MKVKIDIDTKTFVRFGFVVLAFVVGLLIISKTRGALTTIGISLFLALALNPPVSWLSRHIPGNSRVGATAIAYVVVVALLGGLVFTVAPPVVQQSSKFAESVPGLIDEATAKRVVFDRFVEQYGLEDEVDSAINNAKGQASSVASNLGNVLVGGANAFLNGLINVLLVLVLSFLMLIEGPNWLRRVWGLYKDQDQLEEHRALIRRMYRVVTGFVNGQLFVAFIAAVSTLATILILSAVFPLPANLAIPLAAIVFMTGFIPMIGATIGGILVTLILLLNDVGAAITFLIFFIVYQQIENNFISPTVQAKTVELSALTIIIAITIGVSLFGLIGGIISIPIAGCIRVLSSYYIEQNRKIRAQKESKNPVTKLIAKAKES